MGLRALLAAFFGGGRNIVSDTAEVFRVNAEAADQRQHAAQEAALAQFSAEFSGRRTGWFNGLVDGLNRLPRPLMAFGVIALFGSAMVDPVWFSERMIGLQAVPEPLWYILGAIVSFFFGARELHKHRSLRAAPVGKIVQDLGALHTMRQEQHQRTNTGPVPGGNDRSLDSNPALDAIMNGSANDLG